MSHPDDLTQRAEKVARSIAHVATREGRTVALAESLTGGKISCHLGAAPDSSDWFGGCVVAYTSEVKRRVLGVPDGPVVSKEAAAAMAKGAADLLGCDLAVAVTGVGGPEEQDGEPPGTVWFGVCDRGTVTTELHRWDGEPEEVLDRTTLHALTLLERVLDAHAAPS
ncbi:MAG TPA: CinA family protein [Intrasporangium sp.]|uniref:CinA family protein n=1 Tax=Intrasporangium sp. TaxID=1925024 RepID=UPI002B49A1E6|nr:CinA family protein [Intrasporangium sp.]HKX67391.1 CinA family protein [Intrasporangium sp.]